METTMMRVRIPALERTWLSVQAKNQGRSLNAEILAAIREQAKSEPLKIEIRHGFYPDGTEDYVVAYNLSLDEFFSSANREDAFAAAFSKAKELGLPRSSVRLVVEHFGYAGTLARTEEEAA